MHNFLQYAVANQNVGMSLGGDNFSDMNALLPILCGASGISIGAVFQALREPNYLSKRLSFTPKRNNVQGTWKSFWGDTESEVRTNEEKIEIIKQRGARVWGRATRRDEPRKIWSIEGRHENDCMMLVYSPAKESKDQDFLDYGCYFLKREPDGLYKGFSTTFGKGGAQHVAIDWHQMERNVSKNNDQ